MCRAVFSQTSPRRLSLTPFYGSFTAPCMLKPLQILLSGALLPSSAPALILQARSAGLWPLGPTPSLNSPLHLHHSKQDQFILKQQTCK